MLCHDRDFGHLDVPEQIGKGPQRAHSPHDIARAQVESKICVSQGREQVCARDVAVLEHGHGLGKPAFGADVLLPVVKADQPLFERFLGMRVETIDTTEFLRRIDKGIFDPAEFKRAMKWVEANCREGMDYNPPGKRRTRQQLDAEWQTSVKMALIARDLMIGNPALEKMGFGEEALGRNAIASGFQGQRQWTDFIPNGDFMEAILNSSFDWNGLRQAFMVATENDSLNGVSMLFGHLLNNCAQVFSDVRTFWSPDAVERVTGWKPTGKAKDGFIHLINSGSSALDGTGEQSEEGNPVMKPYWK